MVELVNRELVIGNWYTNTQTTAVYMVIRHTQHRRLVDRGGTVIHADALLTAAQSALLSSVV